MRTAILALAFLVILIAGCTINPQDTAAPPKGGQSGGNGNASGVGNADGDGNSSSLPKEAVFTMAQVAKHSTNDDCWIVIEGKILDLRAFASHPGGGAYMPYCGTDGTSAFNDKGGIGTNHWEDYTVPFMSLGFVQVRVET